MVRYGDWVVNYSVGVRFSAPTETSAAMSRLFYRFHYFICISAPTTGLFLVRISSVGY